jgi:hypothetical protein
MGITPGRWRVARLAARNERNLFASMLRQRKRRGVPVALEEALLPSTPGRQEATVVHPKWSL